MAQATLANQETGVRKAVEENSQEARDLFSQGFQLEQSFDPETNTSTFAEQPSANLNVEQPEENIDPNSGDKNILNDLTTSSKVYEPSSVELTQKMTDMEKELLTYQQKLQTINEQEQKDTEKEGQRLEDERLGLSDPAYLTSERTKLYEKYGVEAKMEAIGEVGGLIKSAYDKYFKKVASISGGGFASIAAGKKANALEDFKNEMAGLDVMKANAMDNYNLARQVATDYMGDIISSNTSRIDAYDTLLSLNNNKTIRLEAEEKAYVEDNKKLMEDTNDRLELEKTNIQDLWTENPVAWQKAGINPAIDDMATIQAKLEPYMVEGIQIQNMMANYPDARIRESDSLSSAEKKVINSGSYRDKYTNTTTGGANLVDSTYDSVMQNVLDEGGTPLQAAMAVASMLEGTGINVTPTQISGWQTKASGMTAKTTDDDEPVSDGMFKNLFGTKDIGDIKSPEETSGDIETSIEERGVQKTVDKEAKKVKKELQKESNSIKIKINNRLSDEKFKGTMAERRDLIKSETVTELRKLGYTDEQITAANIL